MARTLRLTSPFMRGEDIRQLQVELKKDGYLQGKVDGVFGPDTSRAVYRAKYWLGYNKPNQSASSLLYNYLSGKKQPTEAMRNKARTRKKAQAAIPRRVRMIREARQWINTKESPAGSNRVIFSKWYGLVGPWCAMFVSYCGAKVGAPQFRRASRWAYCPYIVNDARAGKNGLAITYDPKEGDLVLFDWDHDGLADHIGFFDHWVVPKSTFATIEGNTGIGNDSNGGQVMRRERQKSQVQAFVHVGG